jgi:hypothetical protein
MPATQDHDEDVIIEDGVEDLDENAEVVPVKYTISSYGADYPVDGVVTRINNGDIKVPTFDPEVTAGTTLKGFQRKLVWGKRQADRFVESLLLGFPVPGIFLVKQPDNVLLVLDGAQRLRTLQSFYSGTFKGKEFKLKDVQKELQGKGYNDLDPADRRRLDNSIIHATIIRQEEPANDQSSVYLVFERLNNGGTLLQPQEIRVALYHGLFVEALRKLNDTRSWRILFGPKSAHLKDQELILRFFAMLDWHSNYSRPMKDFLNQYMNANRTLSLRSADDLTKPFTTACSDIATHIGPKAFRLKSAVNAAVAESVLFGIARRQQKGPIRKPQLLKKAYDALLKDVVYIASVTRATADEERVKNRLRLAEQAFAKVN